MSNTRVRVSRQIARTLQPMPVTIKRAHIVVAFDLCSSSQIMEDLLLSEKFDRYETFLTCVKRWLMNWTSKHAPGNGRFGQVKMPYKVEPATCSLRNILSGSGFACRKIDFTVDSTGEELPWPTHETTGWTCARSNWGGPP